MENLPNMKFPVFVPNDDANDGAGTENGGSGRSAGTGGT